MKVFEVIYKNKIKKQLYSTYEKASLALSSEGYDLIYPKDGHTYSCDIWFFNAEKSCFNLLLRNDEAKIIERDLL